MFKRALLLVSLTAVTAFAASSPVVQVISYSRDASGSYTMLGWGSGSIIDSSGNIITNNHVVDDGKGGISDEFSICVTEASNTPPRCYLTASLVSRDAEMDIAVLRIDPTDISGQTVSFSSLPVLPVNYAYVPETGDTVIARGYPWVGSNTITDTQGVISGTAEYNNFTYIKTDALIAGGNSGGPLLVDGSLVGVNTFLVGGFFDPALGYALSIAEAEMMITSSQQASTLMQETSPVFQKLMYQITEFSRNKKVVDNLATITLSSDYTVRGYTPGEYILLYKTSDDTTSVLGMELKHQTVGSLNTDEAIIRKLVGSWDDPKNYKFTDVSIGWLTWKRLDAVDLDTSKSQQTYIYTYTVNQHLLTLSLVTPLPTRDTYDRIQANITSFLGNITFPEAFQFASTKNFMFDNETGVIWIDFAPISDTDLPYESFIRALVDYTSSELVLRKNLDDNIAINVVMVENSFEIEDLTVEQWMQGIDKYIDVDHLRAVTYKWHPWFMGCYEDIYSIEEPYVCEVVIFIGDQRSPVISFQLHSPASQMKKYLPFLSQIMDKTLIVSNVGETSFSLATKTHLPYDDVMSQSEDYRDMLSELLSLGILSSRPHLSGDRAYTLGEYIRLFVWAVYHRHMDDTLDPTDPKSPTIQSIIDTMPVNQDAYATAYEAYQINELIRLFVSGGKLPSYDSYTLNEFSLWEYDNDNIYWDRIRDFEKDYFQWEEENLDYDTPSYHPTKIPFYVPQKGIQSYARRELPQVVFGSCEDSLTLQMLWYCDTSNEDLIFSDPVLTKWEAISLIYPYVREGMWK